MPTRAALLALLLAPILAVPAGSAFAEPVTIETARGAAEVERPERVVVFDIAALDTLDALGVAPVGAPDRLYMPQLEHLRDGAEVVGTLFEPNFEAVAALEPDLIVIGGRSAAQYDALAKIAPTIDMTISGANRLTEEARDRILAYGTLFGREAEAEALAGELAAAVERTRTAVAGKGDALVILTNGTKMSAFGPGSRFGWIHDELGLPATTVTSYEGSHGEGVSFEFIQKANPDWLVVIDRAAAVGQEAEGARATLDNPLVAETTAWREGNLVLLDPTSIYIANGGVRTLTGLLDQITDAFEG